MWMSSRDNKPGHAGNVAEQTRPNRGNNGIDCRGQNARLASAFPQVDTPWLRELATEERTSKRTLSRYPIGTGHAWRCTARRRAAPYT
jgi:hypothetical protein